MTRDPAPVFRSMASLRRHIEAVGAKRIVLANGCFDPLHAGHVRYLQGAKTHGDFLVVALNDDRSTRALKGEKRPVVATRDRARLLAGVAVVDAVLVFGARDVRRILKGLMPATHARGTDDTAKETPERETARELGIEIVGVGGAKSHASGDVVDAIRRSVRKDDGV